MLRLVQQKEKKGRTYLLDARSRQRAGRRRDEWCRRSPRCRRLGRESESRERGEETGDEPEREGWQRAELERACHLKLEFDSVSSRGDPAEPTARLELGRDVYADILEDEEKYFYLVEAHGRVD